MQVYDSGALKDNLDVGKAALVRCSISCVCTSAFLLPVKEADPQLAMGPPGRGFGDFSCEMGVAGSIPRKTNCDRTWTDPGILFHGFSAQP